jgi:hypothetical protein
MARDKAHESRHGSSSKNSRRGNNRDRWNCGNSSCSWCFTALNNRRKEKAETTKYIMNVMKGVAH